MSNVRIKINKAGIGSILRGDLVREELLRRAEAIAEKANSAAGLDGGFVAEAEIGRTRARAVVVTATADAMVAEATNRTLTRSIDAGRG